MQLQEMSWPAVEALSKDVPVVVPIAAMEQHGRHMPVFTDSMLLGEVVRRAADRLGDRVAWTPLFVAGQLAPPPRLRRHDVGRPADVPRHLSDLVENLLTHGFRRIVLLNGHGGNIVPAQQAVFEARQRHRGRGDLLLLSATYWTAGGDADTRPIPSIEQTRMGHACEWETSMMLRLAPHLVGDLTPGRADRVRATLSSPPRAAGSPRTAASPATSAIPRPPPPRRARRSSASSPTTWSAFLGRVIAWDGRGWDA